MPAEPSETARAEGLSIGKSEPPIIYKTAYHQCMSTYATSPIVQPPPSTTTVTATTQGTYIHKYIMTVPNFTLDEAALIERFDQLVKDGIIFYDAEPEIIHYEDTFHRVSVSPTPPPPLPPPFPPLTINHSSNSTSPVPSRTNQTSSPPRPPPPPQSPPAPSREATSMFPVSRSGPSPPLTCSPSTCSAAPARTSSS